MLQQMKVERTKKDIHLTFVMLNPHIPLISVPFCHKHMQLQFSSEQTMHAMNRVGVHSTKKIGNPEN